jgi:hypothetical protein
MQTLRKLPTQAPKTKTKHKKRIGYSAAKATGPPIERKPFIDRV